MPPAAGSKHKIYDRENSNDMFRYFSHINHIGQSEAVVCEKSNYAPHR